VVASAPVRASREPGVGSWGVAQSVQTATRLQAVLLALAVFALALGPRWVAREAYVTADEDNWMRRAGGFAWGLANGRPGRTYQNGHPGVLTMELAILGQGPGGAERFADPVTGNPRLVTAVPGFFDGLVEARRAFALATAALITLLTLLSWRLFGPGVSVLSGVLLALDPFYLGHSQLVHLDALLSGCMALALLCGLVRWGSNGSLSWVVAGGVCSGLALLAKVPAVYLGPFVPMLAVGLAHRRGARALARDAAVWALSSLAAFVALWPSLWVNPEQTMTRMAAFARETGGQPHEQGSFFLGQAVVDPGLLFYLVALPLRLSPLTLVGLLALALVAVRWRRFLDATSWRLSLGLLAYAAGFCLFMTLGAKKFDRYVLPSYLALDLLAALGIWGVWRVVEIRSGSWRALAAVVGGAMVLLAASWPAWSTFPHYLTYYDPLLGGGPAAAKLIPVGEGEGLREVAEWLNARPEAEKLYVAAHSFDALKANFVGNGEALRDRVPSSADYVVIYLYRRQIGFEPRTAAEYAQRQPEYVVTLNGLDYARVYRGPRQ
jgi:hypothetical protein